MEHRRSGILLHMTSLPSPFGIGDLGPWAYRFADFLSQSRQTYWQVLPINPTDQAMGNSPYSSPSAFAGNKLLISPQRMIESGFLTQEDVGTIPPFPDERCDFSSLIPYKNQLLHLAYERFKNTRHQESDYEVFCQKNSEWLDDFALFMVIKHYSGGVIWGEWEPELRDRKGSSLKKIEADYRDELEREKFFQYLFFKQWLDLKLYCNQKGIELLGDLPIYVNYDSVDVWKHPELFKLTGERKPLVVAGVPPDYFSKTGQLWGNPIYRWEALRRTRYRWWFQRISHNLQFVDALRIDHIRGFVSFWEIPAHEKTAVNGHWVKGPADHFFSALLKRFPTLSLVAEDLGIITPDVKEMMERFGFPGMKVLVFAFGGELATHPYLPHNYTSNSIVYTGTHDNNTARGWFEKETSSEDRQRLFRYLSREIAADQVPHELIRLAMMSVAKTAMIPMQDVLGLGQEGRMNYPSVAQGNWEWRLLPGQLTDGVAQFLRDLTETCGRAK
jgi:4-alpha-glucanotransferase